MCLAVFSSPSTLKKIPGHASGQSRSSVLCITIGLSIAPRDFTKLTKEISSTITQLSSNILMCLWWLVGFSRFTSGWWDDEEHVNHHNSDVKFDGLPVQPSEFVSDPNWLGEWCGSAWSGTPLLEHYCFHWTAGREFSGSCLWIQILWCSQFDCGRVSHSLSTML